MGRKRRNLTPEEAELWRRVQKTASPLRRAPSGGGADAASSAGGGPAPPAPAPGSTPRPASGADLSNLSIGGKAAAGAPKHLNPSHGPRQPPRMDAKAYGRMRRGKLAVEGRIDLHGLTLSEAHPRLVSFVTSSHAAGRRLVLVITGKGRDGDGGDPVPMRRGILRRQVPHWLASPALRGIVMQVNEAHRRHGGSGAFYVYLRRK